MGESAEDPPIIIQPGETGACGIVNLGSVALAVYPPARPEPAEPTGPGKKRPRTVPCPGCNRKFPSHGAMMWHRKAKEH